MNRKKSFSNGPLLYLVATPIGNLGEISKRALEVLNDADIIACEDTRNSKSLLLNYGIHKDLVSLHEHNENEASKNIISLLKQGKKVVYISDAGYPGISDPGYLLVKAAVKNDIAVSTVCGSSAFLNALVASGLPTDHFYFMGFLSAKDGDARRELTNLKQREESLIFYESPHRIKRTISLMLEVLGNRNVTLARELTKLNEEFIRGTLEELSTIQEETLKGEMVIIVEGQKEKETISDELIIQRINLFVDKGMSKKDAIEIVADDYSINKNYVKSLVLK